MDSAGSIRRVELRASGSAYAVLIGRGALADLGRHVGAALRFPPGRAMLVHDSGLPGSIVEMAWGSLARAGYETHVFAFAASEAAKSLETLETLLVELAKAKLDRRDPVVALGGGVVGDVAGFGAAVYRRGVPLIQCPTTLLAMVDASVGGKTGVNLEIAPGDLRKNLAGSFHQPSLVVADTGALESLPPREYAAGLAECVKHALIGADARDPGLAEWLGAKARAVAAGDPAVLAELIARNVAVKARIVELDPTERAPANAGGRALLNLGHTFAHAIETIPALGLNHGEAVGLGLLAASTAAAAIGLVGADHAGWVRQMLTAFGLPTAAGPLPDDDALRARMQDDKKVLSGVLRLVLPCGRWHARVVENPPETAVRAGWGAIRSGARA